MSAPAIDERLARRLVAGQFPQWAELPITPVEDDGWDNRTFRLGAEMTVRLPSGDWYALQVDKEQRLGDEIDGDAARRVWDDALAAGWDGEPVWFHGDVAEGNLLLRDGRLAAVIDFGTSGVGDPACDAVIAWTLLSGPSRDAFRAALGVDPGTWSRGRGWGCGRRSSRSPASSNATLEAGRSSGA